MGFALPRPHRKHISLRLLQIFLQELLCTPAERHREARRADARHGEGLLRVPHGDAAL